jgi:hypothetical protein
VCGCIAYINIGHILKTRLILRQRAYTNTSNVPTSRSASKDPSRISLSRKASVQLVLIHSE